MKLIGNRDHDRRSAIDHDEWTSCSHWGMFPVPRKTGLAWRGMS